MLVKAERILCSEAEGPRFMAVADGIIQEISEDLSPFPGNDVVDFAGCTLSPFFCDYHLHFFKEDISTPQVIAGMLLSMGIKKAYEGGDRQGAGLAMKRALAGEMTIMSSGYAIYKKGGYGSFIGCGVDTAAEAIAVIHELQDLGADYIKVIHSGIFDPASGSITGGGFEADELRQIVGHARERGLDVFCHANGEKAVREAVDAGVSAIVHGLQVKHETLSTMAERKVAFIPTLNAFRSLLVIAKEASARLHIERAVEGHLSAVSEAFHKGVHVLPGSDAGPKFIPFGKAYSEELRLLLSAGIPYNEVIRAASMGPLKKGMPADFLVLDGLEIKQIVHHGQILD